LTFPEAIQRLYGIYKLVCRFLGYSFSVDWKQKSSNSMLFYLLIPTVLRFIISKYMIIYVMAFQVTQSCAVTRDTTVSKAFTTCIFKVKVNNGGSAVSDTTVTSY